MTATTPDTRDHLAALGIPELSPEQIRAIDEDGFFVVEGVFTEEQCDRMTEAADALWAAEGEGPVARSPKRSASPDGCRTSTTSRMRSTR